MRPAMVVLALAVVILAIFFVLGVTSSPAPKPAHHTVSTAAVPGSALRSEPAASLLSPVVQAGAPPANVLDAVLLPNGVTRIAHRHNNGGVSQYDAQVTFRSDATQADLITFFAAAMKLQGWQILDRGPAAHHPDTIEVLGKLAGTDGYYWEMGAIVPPTTFAAGGAGAGASGQGQTDVTIRLFQVPDAQ